MGEAKRRAASDPNFGRPIPTSAARGLVVRVPRTDDGEGFTIHGNLDAQDLRSWLLFWDRLAWPFSTLIGLGGDGPDEHFLIEAGVLHRPVINDGKGLLVQEIPEILERTHVRAFMDLEKREPGQWSIALGAHSRSLRERHMLPDAGALVELHGAFPVPNADVPLNEVIEFKNRRSDELSNLRAELDGFVAAVNQATDKEAEIRKHLATIDGACADAIKVSREWGFPVRLANVKASVELRPFVTAAGGVIGIGASLNQGLPASAAVLAGVGGAIAATAPALKISADFGWRGLKSRLGPYRYVYQYHKELF